MMAQTTKNDDFQSPAAGTSVHPVETSVPRPPPRSYRSCLLSSCLEEYTATQSAYLAWDKVHLSHKAFDLDCCRSLAYFAVKTDSRTVHIVSNSCRLRWCPLCSRARSSFISASVENWILTFKNPKFLTLTLRHSCDSLESQILRLYGCFRLLRKRKFWKRLVVAGCWFFQIKKSSADNSWHPHLHVCLNSEFIPHGLLSKAWKEITGDSEIVDIRSIYKPSVAAGYVARYSARPAELSNLSPKERAEVLSALHGRRILGKFGRCGNLDLSGKSPDDKSDFDVVANFEDAHDHFATSATIRVLLAHYRSGEPLPDSFDVAACKREFLPQTPHSDPVRPPPQPDPLLFG